MKCFIVPISFQRFSTYVMSQALCVGLIPWHGNNGFTINILGMVFSRGCLHTLQLVYLNRQTTPDSPPPQPSVAGKGAVWCHPWSSSPCSSCGFGDSSVFQ